MRENSAFYSVAGMLPQIIAVLTGTVSAICDGMQYGWSAPFIPLLKAPDSPVKISDTDVLWLEQIYMLGALAGLPATIYFVDKIGRKKSILLASVSNLIGWILIGAAPSVEYIYVARFFGGLGGDMAFVAAPMYIAEIADQKIRGFLAGVIYLMMLVGIMIVYSVAPFVPLYVVPVIGSVILVSQLIVFPFMPESPYYLLAQDKYDEAKASLQKLRGKDEDIEKEIIEIASAVKRQKTERGRPQDLILSNSNRKALIIMTVLNAAQHMSSISVILMNLHSILEAAGSIYLQSTTAAIIFSGMMLISATAADFIVDKCGRKILLTLSSLLTGASLLVLATFFALKRAGAEVDGVSWLPIVSIMVYAVVFKFGLGMVPIVMTAELFPAKVKAMGMAFSDAMYVVFSLISIEIYQRLADNYGIHVPFFVFSGSCLFTAAFSVFYIPETKGKTLDEIQFILKGEPFPGSVEDGAVKDVSNNQIHLKSTICNENGNHVNKNGLSEINNKKSDGVNISSTNNDLKENLSNGDTKTVDDDIKKEKEMRISDSEENKSDGFEFIDQENNGDTTIRV